MKHVVLTVSNDLTNDRRMIRIATVLYNMGYQVTLIGRKLKGSLPLDKQPYAQRRLSLFFNKGKLFYIELNIRLFFYLLFKKFDIIGVVDLDTALPGYYLKRLKHKRLIYDAHEYFPYVPEVVNRPKVKRFWELVEQKIMKRANLVYTVSYSIRKDLSFKYGRKVDIILNAPVLKVDISSQQHDNFILYQGALNVGRGLEILIDSCAFHDHTIVIAGDGDIAEDLIKRTKDKGLEDRVQFLGMVTPKRLGELTEKAWIGVNLLDPSSKNYYYSLANKFFDYFHAHKPQVSMKFPDYEKLNKEGEVAVLLEDYSLDAFVQSVKELEDEKKYAKLQANCNELKQKFNWETESKKLINLWNSVLPPN